MKGDNTELCNFVNFLINLKFLNKKSEEKEITRNKTRIKYIHMLIANDYIKLMSVLE